jgi:hypothetical protein
MSSAFRSLGPALERRLEQAVQCTETTKSAMDAYARRVARCAAGLVACAGGLLMFGSTLAPLLERSFPPSDGGLYTKILLFSIVLAIVTHVGVRILFAIRGARLAAPPALTGDPARDLAVLETRPHLQSLARRVARLELASVALPLAGWALLAPLGIHFVVGTVLYGAGGSPLKLEEFDEWISASTVLVGLAHLALVACAFFYARKLRRLDTAAIGALGHGDWGRALGFTALLSLFPGALLLFVPTVLVVLTGLLFIPATFRWMHHRVLAERRSLALALA